MTKDSRKEIHLKVFINCMLADPNRKICALVLVCAVWFDVWVCVRYTHTHTSACLMCARVLQEKAEPQEAPTGSEYMTVSTDD